MKKIILAFTLILTFCSAFAQNITLKVPKFKDPEVQAYFNWHSNYLQKYLKAVRQNDKAAIKTVFENGASQTTKAIAIMEIARTSGEEEYKKVQDYSRQTVPIMREVSKSAYVQQLTKEYMKTHK